MPVKFSKKIKSMTVKQAIGQLKPEQLKDVNLDEIESEEDALIDYKQTKKVKQETQQSFTRIIEVNGSVIIRLG
mgnify:CR=1 FL=1